MRAHTHAGMCGRSDTRGNNPMHAHVHMDRSTDVFTYDTRKECLVLGRQVMAYIVLAYIVLAYIVMAPRAEPHSWLLVGVHATTDTRNCE